MRFLLRRLGNFSIAEELTQEVWVRAASADGTTAIELPRSYLFRIASNLAIDHQRHVRHAIEIAGSDETVRDIPALLPSPEQTVVDRGELVRLKRVVEGLPPRCRDVFILAKFEGLTYQEIAVRLGISKNTVTTHMVTALAALERAMAHEEPR